MKKNRLGKEHLEDRALSRFPFLTNREVNERVSDILQRIKASRIKASKEQGRKAGK